MEKNQNYSHTKKKKKKNKVGSDEEICPICFSDLYLDESYTKKVGLLDINNKNKYLGWMCPECKSEFDVDNNIMYIYGEDFDSGKA